ncbi:unnamed protein product [Lota lota]
MTDSVVVEGYVRFRDGKKWKTRWVALRKPSPVADCLVLLVFKDKSEKAQGHRERASITLEDICGLEASGQGLEGAPYTLAVLCLTQATLLGFDSKDMLLAWEIRIRYSLGEVHRFNVGVLPGTKLEGGAATLHICNNLLALARDSPPVIIGHWNLPDLRRYGPVPNGFVFEGGTRCGYWAGVFFLASSEGEHISFLFDCIVRGVSPNRSPFGLRPVLPGQPAMPVQSEEEVNQEDQELERRLSLLSHRYTSSAYAGGAGDDRSLSGSSDTSDTSRSDGSVGSRLTVWAEPGPAPGPAVGPGPGTSDVAGGAAGPVGFARLTLPSVERLSVGRVGGGGGGGARPLAKPPRPLQEIGRQRSSDSGIATTGSHSSYSGSFSSYTGSLDGVPGEEYAPGAGPPPSSPAGAAADPLGPCTCGSSSERGHAHQGPASPGHLYATPRSVARDDDQPRPPAAAPLQTPAGVPTTLPPPPPRSAESEKAGGVTGSLSPPPPHPGHVQALVQSGESRRSSVAPPGDSCQSSTSKTGCTVCSTCGGYKGPPYSPTSGPRIPAITADQGVETPVCLSGAPGEPGGTSSPLNISEDPDAPLLTRGDPPGKERLAAALAKKRRPTPLPKNGREKLASLLADLTGRSDAEADAGALRLPEDRTGAPGLYESMRSALGTGAERGHLRTPCLGAPPQTTPSREESAVIYENCLKCIGDRCHPPPPPPRFPSSQNHRGSSASLAAGVGPLASSGPFPREGATLDDGEAFGLSVAVEEKTATGEGEHRGGRPANEATERNCEAEEKAKCELLGSSGPLRYLQEPKGAVFVFPPEGPIPERPWPGDGVTYVNIPISPTSKKQLNYMELEIQEAGGPGFRGQSTHLPAQRAKGGSTKYALIDITATETAHKVGTQHALGRQEGLHALESRRRGAPQ